MNSKLSPQSKSQQIKPLKVKSQKSIKKKPKVEAKIRNKEMTNRNLNSTLVNNKIIMLSSSNRTEKIMKSCHKVRVIKEV